MLFSAFRLSDKDGISHDLSEPVTNGMNLIVNLIRILEEEVHVPIAPKVDLRNDDSLAPGQVVYIEGADGVMVETWAVTYNNGVEIGQRADRQR